MIPALLCFVLAASSGLTPDDEQTVQTILTVITGVLGILILGLVGFAYSIRFIARNRTRPCPLCTEFIPNTETVCPRCGKSIVAQKS